MGYRHNSSKPSLRDETSQSIVSVQNGAISRFALPCYYVCSETDQLIPIHLRDEGYTSIKVYLDRAVDGLTIDAFIDQEDDWVVRMNVSASCPVAVLADCKTKFSVVADAPASQVGSALRDVIITGELVILHAPCDNNANDNPEYGPYDIDIILG